MAIAREISFLQFFFYIYDLSKFHPKIATTQTIFCRKFTFIVTININSDYLNKFFLPKSLKVIFTNICRKPILSFTVRFFKNYFLRRIVKTFHLLSLTYQNLNLSFLCKIIKTPFSGSRTLKISNFHVKYT